MEERVEIVRGRLRGWQIHISILGQIAAVHAEHEAKEPHTIGWVNTWMDQAETYREILHDFCECTGLGMIEGTTVSSDAMVLMVQKAGLTRWIQRLNKRMALEMLEDLEPTGRRNTPELMSKSKAISGCCAVARISFFEMTCLREPQINPLVLEDSPPEYGEFVMRKWGGLPAPVIAFCVMFKRTLEELQNTLEVVSKDGDLTVEQQAILRDYSRCIAASDIREAEASLEGIDKYPELAVEAEALRADMRIQLPDLDADLGPLHARALDLAERWKAKRGWGGGA